MGNKLCEATYWKDLSELVLRHSGLSSSRGTLPLMSEFRVGILLAAQLPVQLPVSAAKKQQMVTQMLSPCSLWDYERDF